MPAGAPSETHLPELQPPDTAPLVRVIAMPADANPNGDIFGGWLTSQMDLGSSILAAKIAQARGGSASCSYFRMDARYACGVSM